MKKLDNRGWGMKDMWIYLGLITFILIVIAILVNQFESMTQLDTKDSNASVSKKFNIDDEVEKGTIKEIEPTTSNTPENNTKDMNDYYELENSLIIPARSYISKNYTVTDNAVIYVSLKKLVAENYIEQVTTKSGQACSGYVMYQSNQEKYKSYLSCGTEYISTEYDKNYE